MIKKHSLKLPLIISFERFCVLLLEEKDTKTFERNDGEEKDTKTFERND